MKLLRTINIPMLRYIKLSDSRRAKYFVYNPIKPPKLAVKYQDRTKYDYVDHKTSSGNVKILYNLITNERVVANPKSIGTPKVIKINFQMLWNNAVSTHTRNKVALELKESFIPTLQTIEPIKGGFPIMTTFTIHSKNEDQDVDNLTILYIKTFHDTLTFLQIIPDDTLQYIKGYMALHKETQGDDYIEVNIYSLQSNVVNLTRRSLQQMVA